MQGRENRNSIGAKGEELAGRYLEEQGIRVVEVNHRCRIGEIDIVAEDGPTVVFVEVKSKRGRRYGLPEEMVTTAKQRRLTLLGLGYLRSRGWLRRPARFDVIAVEWGEGAEAVIRHHRDAFPMAGGW